MTNKQVILSVTKKIEGKATSKEMKLPYRLVRASYDDLEDIIRGGRLFTGYFGNQFGEWVKPYRNFTDENWKGQNFVGVDVEGSDVIPFQEAIEKIILKPTIAYTTASNGIKGNRYRFIYCFNEPIVKKEEFEALYWRIIGMLRASYNFSTTDHCGSQVSRKFQGNSLSNIEVYRSDIEHSVSSFLAYPSAYNDVKGTKKAKSTVNKPTTSPDTTSKRTVKAVKVEATDKEFMEDVMNMADNVEFLTKWGDKYKIRTSNRPVLEYNEIGVADGSKCYEIVRPWKKVKSNGKTYSKVIKFQDGQHRRSSKLPKAAAQYKAIYGESITLEQLIYCLVFELFHFYNNEVDPISRQDLIKIATWAMGRETTSTSSKHKYVISKEIKNKQAVQGLMRKEEHYKELDALYDITKSFAENLQIMKDSGYKIGQTTLTKYCQERGIKFLTKREENKAKIKAVWMKSEATSKADLIREIYEDTGIKCNYPTLTKYIKEWEAEKEIVADIVEEVAEEVITETFEDYEGEEKVSAQIQACKNLINAIAFLRSENTNLSIDRARELVINQLTDPPKIRDIIKEYQW